MPVDVNARSLILPFLLILTASMAIIQGVIAVAGGDITLLAQVLTVLVAVAIVGWAWLNRRKLAYVRFGAVIVHTIAFVVVTTSFNAHAVLRIFTLGSGDDGFERIAEMLLTTPWFGATLVTSAAWGLGLLLHLTGTVLGRGWED